MTDQNQSNLPNDYDELVSIWESSSGNRYGGRFGGDYFIGESLFGGSGFSNKSLSRSNRGQEYKDTPGADFIAVGDTISLSDMLKTNCSRKGISSVGRMQGFHKLTNLQNQHLQNHTPITHEDDLETVSNRKLQNRANSKRARERRKQQLEHMKQIIRDLRSQNILLKENLGQRGRTIDIGKIQRQRRIGSRWRFCKRCNKQLFLQKARQYQEDPDIENSSQIMDQEQKQTQKQHGHIHLYDGQMRYREKQSCQLSNLTGKRFQIRKEGEQGQKKMVYEESNMEAQFQEIDFGLKSKSKNKNIQTKEVNKNQRRRDRRWVGKMWIALSILMLVLGLHINGFEGGAEKSIRINEKQARRWVSEFEDPQKSGFSVKIKTKLPPNKFIENQKNHPQQQKNQWQDILQNKGYKKQRNKNNNPNPNNNANNLNQQAKSWINSISFQTEQNYARTIIQQQQDEIQIDKDLLFSIHAELDDIGRYI